MSNIDLRPTHTSFKIFLRDNKSKMSNRYPFLCHDQILSKLRQLWKQLNDGQHRSKKKASNARPRETPVIGLNEKREVKKRVKKTDQPKRRHRSRMKSEELTSLTKRTGIFEFDSGYDSSIFRDDDGNDEIDSPFLHIKEAVDNLNNWSNSKKLTEKDQISECHTLPSSKASNQGMKFVSGYFQSTGFHSEGQACIAGGILRTPTQRFHKIPKTRVSFSSLRETSTMETNNVFDFDDSTLDAEQLHIEIKKLKSITFPRHSVHNMKEATQTHPPASVPSVISGKPNGKDETESHYPHQKDKRRRWPRNSDKFLAKELPLQKDGTPVRSSKRLKNKSIDGHEKDYIDTARGTLSTPLRGITKARQVHTAQHKHLRMTPSRQNRANFQRSSPKKYMSTLARKKIKDRRTLARKHADGTKTCRKKSQNKLLPSTPILRSDIEQEEKVNEVKSIFPAEARLNQRSRKRKSCLDLCTITVGPSLNIGSNTTETKYEEHSNQSRVYSESHLSPNLMDNWSDDEDDVLIVREDPNTIIEQEELQEEKSNMLNNQETIKQLRVKMPVSHHSGKNSTKTSLASDAKLHCNSSKKLNTLIISKEEPSPLKTDPQSYNQESTQLDSTRNLNKGVNKSRRGCEVPGDCAATQADNSKSQPSCSLETKRISKGTVQSNLRSSTRESTRDLRIARKSEPHSPIKDVRKTNGPGYPTQSCGLDDASTKSNEDDDDSEGDIAMSEEEEEDESSIFCSRMATQTNAALLHALMKLRARAHSPEVTMEEDNLQDSPIMQTSTFNSDCDSETEGEDNLLAEPVGVMFQDPAAESVLSRTPAKRRLVASGIEATPSNFGSMFQDQDFFL